MGDSTRRRWPPRSRRARLLAAALVSALLVAGCGGGSSSPPVAALSSTTTSASGTRTATTPSEDATVLLVEWASCMRRHGDPNQADPTITVNKVIVIAWNSAIPGGYGGTNKGGQGNSGPGQYCRSYLAAAQAALRGGRPLERPNPAAVAKLAECMRANGVPDFPDPSASGSVILPGNPDQNANNPTFENASKVCARKTGVSFPSSSSLPAGTITLSGG